MMIRPAHLLACMVIPSLALITPTEAAKDTPVEVKKRLINVQEQIRATRARFARVRGRAGALEIQLARLETKAGDIAHKLNRSLRRLTAERAALAALQQRKRKQLAELDRQRRSLARELRVAYALGRQARLKLLLNQQDPQAVGRILVYYDYISRARARRIGAANQVLVALRATEAQITTHGLELEAVADSLRRQQAQLANARDRRAQVLAALEEQAVATGDSLTGLIQHQGELERLLESIETVLADIPPSIGAGADFGKLKGKLPWPSVGPIVAHHGDLGSRPSVLWNGVVISARWGAQVRAVYGGRVEFADWMPGLGLLTIIDHGSGYMSLYGHNQSLYQTVGEWVEAGELIARVGDSGGRSESGLYFEIRHRGEPVDPKAWCKTANQLVRAES